MKLFHIGDVLSVTTGRMVSRDRIGGVYNLLNFLTGDKLFTHQLPRAARECEPWLRTQFPQLFLDSPLLSGFGEKLDARIKEVQQDVGPITLVCNAWVEEIRLAAGLPKMVPVYEMGADMHTRIDPIEEAQAMFGNSKVIPVEVD